MRSYSVANSTPVRSSAARGNLLLADTIIPNEPTTKRGRPSEPSAQAGSSLPNEQVGELLRLRSELGLLRRQTNELLRLQVDEDAQGARAGVEYASRAVVGGMQENEHAQAKSTVLAVNLLGTSRREKASA